MKTIVYLIIGVMFLGLGCNKPKVEDVPKTQDEARTDEQIVGSTQNGSVEGSTEEQKAACALVKELGVQDWPEEIPDFSHVKCVFPTTKDRGESFVTLSLLPTEINVVYEDYMREKKTYEDRYGLEHTPPNLFKVILDIGMIAEMAEIEGSSDLFYIKKDGLFEEISADEINQIMQEEYPNFFEEKYDDIYKPVKKGTVLESAF